MSSGEPERDHAPHRVADQHGPFQTESSHHLGDIGGHGRDRHVVLARARAPVAPQIEGDDAVGRGKIPQLIAPDLGRQVRPVEQDEGRAFPHLDQVRLPAVTERHDRVRDLVGHGELGVLRRRERRMRFVYSCERAKATPAALKAPAAT